MKSSDSKIDREKVQALVDCFLDVIEGTLNTVDQIADVNTIKLDGGNYIKSANFRMNIRNLKVQLLADLQEKMSPDSLTDTTKE